MLENQPGLPFPRLPMKQSLVESLPYIRVSVPGLAMSRVHRRSITFALDDLSSGMRSLSLDRSSILAAAAVGEEGLLASSATA